MTVGVVVPVYQGADFVGDAIESILAQSYEAFEVVVVDDGSTDGSAAVVRSYDDDRISLVRHETSQGVGAARNRGVRAVDGELVAFLDHDDVWRQDKLQRHVDRHRRANADLVYSDLRHVDAGGAVQGRARCPDPKPPGEPLVRQLLLGGQLLIMTLSSVTIRRSAWDAVGGCDPAMAVSDDIDLYCRLAGDWSFDRIAAPLVDKRDHGANLSDDYRAIYDDNLRILDAALERYPFLTEADADRRRARLAYSRATSELQAGASAEALSYGRESLKADPRLRPLLVVTLALGDRLAGPFAPGQWVFERYDRRFG